MIEDGNHDVLDIVIKIKPGFLEGEGIGQRVAVSLKARSVFLRLHPTLKEPVQEHTITAAPILPVDVPPTKFSTPAWFSVSQLRGVAP